jgi:hypothetical protein
MPAQHQFTSTRFVLEIEFVWSKQCEQSGQFVDTALRRREKEREREMVRNARLFILADHPCLF